MKLQFNAVWQLQTVVICPSCDKEGKDAGFKDCCFRFALSLLGIQGYKPYPEELANGCNSECQHHSLDGRCAM